MRWPRGKYNGRRIVGFETKVRLDLSWWSLGLPSFRRGKCGSFGPIHVWIEAAYDYK